MILSLLLIPGLLFAIARLQWRLPIFVMERLGVPWFPAQR